MLTKRNRHYAADRSRPAWTKTIPSGYYFFQLEPAFPFCADVRRACYHAPV